MNTSSPRPQIAPPGKHLQRSTWVSIHICPFWKTARITISAAAISKLFQPAYHWKVTLGDPKLTRLNNFRIRLIVGCGGLGKDTARFRVRNTGAMPNDSSCKLCYSGSTEDAVHFISCPALAEERQRLLSDAPPSVCCMLPDPRTRPHDFCEILIGTCWIDDFATQKFCIEFLNNLRIVGFRCSTPIPVHKGQLSRQRRKERKKKYCARRLRCLLVLRTN